MTNKETENNMDEKTNAKLMNLAEKYCKHDNRNYNSCLYWIFKIFIEKNFMCRKVLKTQFKKLSRLCYFKAKDKEPTEVVTLKDLNKLL